MKDSGNLIKRLLCLATFASSTLCWCDTIELTNGKIQKGELSGRRAQYVSITRKEAQSEIEIRVKPEDILRIQFSDAFSKQEAIDRFHSGDPSQAISLLEPLVKRRIPYLDLLSETDERLFVMLLESYVKTGRAADCLEQAKLWQTKLQAPQALTDIEELQIIASWQMQRPEEAAYYAQRWIDSGRSAEQSAIAWNVLAENALKAGDTRAALWTALNPIVFSRPNQPRHLAQTYEIAIVAANRMGYPRYAKELLEEMRSRGLAWPIDSQRVDTLQQLDAIEPKDTERFFSHPSSNSPQGRSAKTLSKLVGLP